MQKGRSRTVPRALLLLAAIFAAPTGAQAQKSQPTVHPAEALELMSGDSMLKHIQVLAADSFEGRKPGTRGGDLTERYIERIFRDLGLGAGGLDNSYYQKVPLIGTRYAASAKFTLGGRTISARVPDDMVVGRTSPGPRPLNLVNSPVIFVGFGIVAPESGRDDYKNVDVTGKTVILLSGKPKAEAGGAALSPIVTSLLARTDAAYAKGADAVFAVHDSTFLGTAWSAIANPLRGERLRLAQSVEDAPTGLAHLRGFMSHDFFLSLLPDNARDWNALIAQATRSDFRPIDLNGSADVHLQQIERAFTSRNVVAKLGADPNLRDEWVVVTAHWDHLGRDTTLAGDQIFNGAIDNAGGIAEMIEMARAMLLLPKPRRSVLFVATTGEESGMLGTQYYVSHPLYPLERTLADINLDWFFPWPKTRDYFETGFGSSTLDTLLVTFAKEQDRTVSKDPWPEQNFYFRSDHLPFAQAGVPSLFGGMGLDIAGKDKQYGKTLFEQYDKHDYHAVTDSVAKGWTMEGALLDASLLTAVIEAIANGPTYPEWSDDPAYSVFRNRREEDKLKRRK